MSQALVVIFLVSVLEIHAYAPRETINLTSSDENETRAGSSRSNLLIDELPTETLSSRQEDQDPVESSETIVYNRYENPSDDDDRYSTAEEDPEGPPSHAIPYSEHEEPRNVPTKPKYNAPGEWAKPSRNRDASLEDVPTKLLAQVRRTHTVRRLPRKKAIENAESEEEKENAARLREVVKNSKVNTVYTEEGYEDSAYDHAGHIRDADFQEGYARKLHEQMDLRKKSEDDDDEHENSASGRKYKKVDPEEFKDYDEDYKDVRESTTEYKRLIDGDGGNVKGEEWDESVYPKKIVENGIQGLQEDVEREAERTEKSAEEIQASNDQRSLAESRKKGRRKDRKRKRPTSWTQNDQEVPKENLEEQQVAQNDNVYVENYSTARIPLDEDRISTQRGIYETTTLSEAPGNFSSDPAGVYRYEVDGISSPYIEAIDFRPAEENPTTISYSQIFWNYFKAKQNQFPATQPPILESTTLTPNLLQASSFVGNGFLPYPFYGEQTTSFPIVEPAILTPQQLVLPQPLVSPEYSGQGNQLMNTEEPWHPISANEPPTTDQSRLPEIANVDQGISLADTERNLASQEELDENFENPFVDSTLTSLMDRKPRYKITIRQKPKKPAEPLVSVSPNRESSSSINDTPSESPLAGSVAANDNYMKVLMHLRNEDNARNLYSSGAQRSSFLSPTNEYRFEDLTRMRPPPPRKATEVGYQNFLPRGQAEIESPRMHRHGRAYPRATFARPNSFLPPRQLPLPRKRSSMPAVQLLPPLASPSGRYVRHQETSDYLTNAGSRLKQSRNALRPFRQPPIGFDAISLLRAKRRERRSAGLEEGDESSGIVKVAAANNGTSNRGEVDRTAKDPAVEKKSKFYGNDKGREGQRKGRSPGPLHGSGTVEERESRLGRSNLNESAGTNVWGDLRDLKKGVEGESVLRMESESESRDQSSEESSKRTSGATNGIVESKVTGASFNRSFEEELKSYGLDRGRGLLKGSIEERENFEISNASNSSDRNGNSKSLKEGIDEDSPEHSSLHGDRGKHVHELEEPPGKPDNTTNKKINGHSVESNEKELKSQTVDQEKSLGSLHRRSVSNEKAESSFEVSIANSNLDERETARDTLVSSKGEEVNSVRQKRSGQGNQGRHSHEDLLEESPKITEDIIEEEIGARFNENQGEKGNEEDREEKMEVDVPDFDYVEELTEDAANVITTTEPTLDVQKYPFYNDERLPSPSALKYAMDPGRIPKKTYGGMEFYDSRDAYKHCDEVEPSLKVLPEKEPAPDRGLNENLPRLLGLGDKLDCFKAKYFDENPFDNPLFLEKEVEEPLPSIELDTKQFASRIMVIPGEDDGNVIQKSSKRPESYTRQRRPDSASFRVQKSRRIRYKGYPRTIRVERPRVYRIRGSNVGYVKARRPQKLARRPVSSASEMSSSYMPYQNQVYEDVMGTIKNMAISNQIDEVSTTFASNEDGVTVEAPKEVKINASANSTSHEDKGKDRASNNLNISIEGLTPPKYSNRFMGFRRNRTPQKSKTRILLSQKPLNSFRTVNRRQKIRIYKRDLRSEEDGEESSTEVISVERDVDKMGILFDEGGKSREEIPKDFYGGFNSTEEIKNVSVPISTNFPAISKSPVAKEKSKVLRSISSGISTNVERDSKEDKSQKVVYTIKDRIRYSKPKGEARRTGKFVNETKVEENRRRKEPTYSYIRRKKPVNSISTTQDTPSLSFTDKIDWTKSAVTAKATIEVDNQELAKENREIPYFAASIETEHSNASKDPEDLSKKDSPEASEDQTANKTVNSYAVHENVNERDTTTQEPSDFSRLKDFLNTDLPGYTELSSEDFKNSFFPRSNSSKDFALNFKQFNQSGEKESNDDASKNSHPSYFSNEESSEKVETNAKIEPSTESSEEAGKSSKESVSEEDRTFFAYTSRPSSPAENYEDERYSDLGPRVNKPAFFHPPFSFSGYRRSEPKTSSEEDTKEIEESGEEKEEYVFPWYRDKADSKRRRRSRYRGKSIGEYEYPWERRERLAQEERRRKKERKRKRFTKSFEDEQDDEDTYAKKYRRNVYPRGRYRFWSRAKEDASEESTSDNAESSSETRPVVKYSSRYSSRNAKLPLDEKKAKLGSVEEISRSIKKALEYDSGESSGEKKFAGSSKNRGNSRGIVPEDVTLAPTRRNEKKEPSNVDEASFRKKEERKGHRNSSTTEKDALDDSESRLTVTKAIEAKNSTNELNSIRQPSKRRRRPLKNVVSVVESTMNSVTEASRNRRRQKAAVTTPNAVASVSSSTTPAPRVVRRKQQKSVKDSRKNAVPVIDSESKSNDKNSSSASVPKSTTLKHRSMALKEKNDGRKSQTIKESIEDAKNLSHEELRWKDFKSKEKLSKHSDNQKKIIKNESAEANSVKTKEKSDRDNAKNLEERNESEPALPAIKNKDENFDFDNDSGFDKSDTISDDNGDYDDEFGSVVKSSVSFTAPNGAVQLSEQGSREVVSTVSWISENYDF